MIINSERLREIRHSIHAMPEISGREINTASYIAAILEQMNPTELHLDVGGTGILAVFRSQQGGKTICFRADLDALPIQENSDFEYKSQYEGVSHACGHDGHASILLGFASWLSEHTKEWKGVVLLLFQPAEETAEGALKVLADRRFSDIDLDYMFGLHNLPGFPMGSIVIKDGVFAVASSGLKVKLMGKTSHAAHPKDGNNPLEALLALSSRLMNLIHTSLDLDTKALITIIHLRLGEMAFGTTPGEAQIMATYRAYQDRTLELLRNKTEQIVQALALAYGLEHALEWVEVFAATVNDKEANMCVQTAAQNLGLQIVLPETPFAWSEDFSFYTQRYKSAFFGLGAGVGSPQLHNPNYDFPDEIMQTAIDMFVSILKGAD